MSIVEKNLDSLVEGDWADIDCFQTKTGTRIYIDYGIEGNGTNRSILYYVKRVDGKDLYLEPCIVKDETI